MTRTKRERERQRKRLGRSQVTGPPDIGKPRQHFSPDVNQNTKDYSLQNLDRLIGEDNSELPDDIILVMLNLMKSYTRENADTYVGYYTPVELLVLASQPKDPSKRIPLDKNCILIHHVTNHWVTSYYMCSKKQLILYDSLKHRHHLEETKKQLMCVYENTLVQNIKCPSVKQQNVLPMCGALAIAYSVTLFLGQNPELKNYCLCCLRKHIRLCLSTGSILPFPEEKCHEQCEDQNIQRRSQPSLLHGYFEDQQQKQTLYSEKVKQGHLLHVDENFRKQHKTLSSLNYTNSYNNTENSEKVERRKQINRERKKAARNDRSPETIQKDRQADRTRKQMARYSMCPDAVRADKHKNKTRMKASRRARSPEAANADKHIDKKRKQMVKDARSPDAAKTDKDRNKTRMKTLRRARSPEAAKTDKDRNKTRMKTLRRARSPEAAKTDKDRNKTRMKTLRRARSPDAAKTDKDRNKTRMKTLRRAKSPEAAKTDKDKNKTRMKASRRARSAEAANADKHIDKKRKQMVRDARSPDAAKTDKDRNKTRMKTLRRARSPEAAKTDKDRNKTRMKTLRRARSPDAAKMDKDRNKTRMKTLRRAKSPEAANADKHIDKKRKQMVRHARSPDAAKTDKDRNKTRMKTLRRARSPDAAKTDKDRNKTRMKTLRRARSPEAAKTDKDRNKTRMKTLRRARSQEAVQMDRHVGKEKKKSVRGTRIPDIVEKDRAADKTRKEHLRKRKSENENVQEQNIIKIYEKSINEGPTYVCTCCQRFLYRRSVIHANKNKYTKLSKELSSKCLTDIITHNVEWICHTCDKTLMTGKIPPQAQFNDMSLTAVPHAIKYLSQLELQLILKIIPFMKIVAMPRGAQHGLRGQVVLVPADLNKVTHCLPRPAHESQIITLALKRRLSDKHSIVKQYIRPEYVTNALAVLKQIHPMYKEVEVRHDWLDISLQQDPDFLKAFVQSETCESDVQSETCEPDESNTNTLEKQNVVNSSERDNNCVDSEDEVDEDNPQSVVTDLQYRQSVNDLTCIQPVSGPEVKTNEILNLAPGEGGIPISMTKEPHWESMAFPQLFPTAKNTYHSVTPRPTKITPKQYINARLLCCDGRFAESPEYAFAALDWLERDAISQNITITTRKHFQQDISVKELKDPLKVSRLLSENQLFTTFRNIRGSPQYFKQMHLDMMAKLRQLGPYTFFITGSAAEFHWPQVIRTVAQQYGESLTDTQIASMNWEAKRLWLQRNPVTAARQIDYIFEQLWGKVILSSSHPVGQVLNYDLRKEMQGRGTAHFHAAIHVKDAPKLDIDSDSIFVAFADKYIKCELPDKDIDPTLHELVLARQCHHHTRTCKKNKQSSCRFGFPKAPSEHTVISRVPKEENAKALKNFAVDILTKMYKELSAVCDQPPTLDSLLERIDVTKEDYNAAIAISHRRTQVIMKRRTSDICINNYNPTILKCLKSNMDIQIITSIWACIAYITSYICKPEKTMSELMRKASKEASDKTIRDKLFSIGNTLRKGREVSHHEAIMKILSIPLRRSSTPVQFIATDYREDRTRILKPKTVLNSMTDEDTDIYVPGIHEKYAARPKALSNICLAEFVANYTQQAASTDEKDTEQDVDTSPMLSTITLSCGLGKMSKRKKPQVIRYHYVSKQKDEELYYHRLLLLYFPWHNEDDLLKRGTYKALFEEHKPEIVPVVQKFEAFYEEVETVIDTFDPDDLQAEIWDELAAQIQQERKNPDNYQRDPNRAFLDTENLPDTNTVERQKTSTREFSLTAAPLMADPQFYNHVQSLNTKQRHLFDYILTWATDIRHQITRDPLYIFLSGGAGVGKSHLIHALFEAVTRTLRLTGHNPNQPTVLLTASTGKAAANINGLTLHSAFGLPVKDHSNKKLQYRKPGAEKLNTLRSNYTNLRLIIADEISMFGAKNLSNLSLALQEIFQEYSAPFAGISILAVGDLLQLNPVGDRAIFKPISDGYEALAGSLWTHFFKLYELQEIMRQKSDPQFAEILSRVRTGEFTDEDEEQLLDLQNTDTSSFGSDTVHIYMYNKQVDAYNEDHIKALTGLITIDAVISRKDRETNKVDINVPETSINNTANLPNKLTIACGAKVMLTKNIDVSDHLVNGIIGIVTEIQMTDSKLKGTIYVDFGDDKIGQTSRAQSPRHLRHCVPIKAVTCSFFLQKPCSISVERTMYPLILAYAITSHKSQGGTYKHVVADLTLPVSVRTVFPGQVYTILSRATCRRGLKLINFSKQKVIVNTEALNEMKDMQLSRNFQWTHPISVDPHTIGFLNIRSLPAHHSDLQADPNIQKLSVLCLSETNVKNEPGEMSIEEFDTFFKTSPHGLAICVKKGIPSSHVQLVSQRIEIMARLIQIEQEEILVICVYKPPIFSKAEFIHELTELIEDFQTYSVFLGGDFNIDPSEGNVADALSHIGLVQMIHHPTHIHGRTLDHIYVPKPFESHAAGAMPLPYTDHMLTWIHI